MTESEWLTCADPSRLLAFVGGMAGERRLRLFSAAACSHHHRQPAIGDAVTEIGATLGPADEVPEPPRPSNNKSPDDAVLVAHRTAYEEATASETDFTAVRALQADRLREILGNPFRGTQFDARWRTADVVGLARGIDEDRAFDRLPLLADALIDAGCDDEQILAHCLSGGSHVRGCWVVDQALGALEGGGA